MARTVTAVVKQIVAAPDEMDLVIGELQRMNDATVQIDSHDSDGFVVVMLTGDFDAVHAILLESFEDTRVTYV